MADRENTIRARVYVRTHSHLQCSSCCGQVKMSRQQAWRILRLPATTKTAFIGASIYFPERLSNVITTLALKLYLEGSAASGSVLRT
eukprot:636653-Amphidinium_carterae.1